MVVSGSYRITSGTWIDSSYGTIFFEYRCSPRRSPLSDAKRMSVVPSRPVSDSAVRMRWTASSTASSVRSIFLRPVSTAVIWLAVMSGLLRM